MKVSYNEGVANHIDPESCVVIRKDGGEALTGGMQAGLLSRERALIRGADDVKVLGRQNESSRFVARGDLAPRGLRHCARMQVSHTGTGRSRNRP